MVRNMIDFLEIPGYKIISEIGRGGIAKVYLAIQEKLNRKVALKILEPSPFIDDVIEARFEREAKTAASLSNVNIVQIFDTGKVDDYYFIVMEYLQESLRDRMKLESQMNPKSALRLIESLFGALEYMHFLGVHHRDIKPANIMFRQDDTPVLVDFGIARAVDNTDGKDLTAENIIPGSPYYMSPEQCAAKKMDWRSDIYSLGVVLYELLSGKRPYIGETPMDVIVHHIQSPIPRLPRKLSRYQPLIDKMMAKNKSERLGGGAEFKQIVDNLLISSLNSTPQKKEQVSPRREETLPSQSLHPHDSQETVLPDSTAKEQVTPGKIIFNNFLDLMKKKLDPIMNKPIIKRLLLGVLPGLVVVILLSIIIFGTGSKTSNRKIETTDKLYLITLLNDIFQQIAQYHADLKQAHVLYKKSDLVNLRKRFRSFQKLKRIENTLEFKNLKDKFTMFIEQLENEYDRCFNAAMDFYNRNELLKAKEWIARAKKLIDPPALIMLENDIDRAYAKNYEQFEPGKDDHAFKSAFSENTAEAFHKYLKEFPRGRHCKEAAAKLRKLQEALKKSPEVKLRSGRQTSFPNSDVQSMLLRYNFFEYKRNKKGTFESHYERMIKQGAAVVTDFTTGLMWYDGPIPKKMKFNNTVEWLQKLNSNNYGGYNNWRLPTLEEKASLLRKNRNMDGLHIDPIFCSHIDDTWTDDDFKPNRTWVVCFDSGTVKIADSKENKYRIRPVRSLALHKNKQR